MLDTYGAIAIWAWVTASGHGQWSGGVGTWQCHVPTGIWWICNARDHVPKGLMHQSRSTQKKSAWMDMKYNPDRHHRRSLRLRHYDYRQAGWYFVTICTYQRQCLFGAIAESQMQLNEYGRIVADCWQSIPSHFSQTQIEEFVVMPNHVHGLIVITDSTPDPLGRDMALPYPYRGKNRTVAQSSPIFIRYGRLVLSGAKPNGF